jgi:hypothetical protein
MIDRRINSREMSAIARPTREDHLAYREYLLDEAGTRVLPVKVDDALFAKAWEDGHSGGYHEVELQYCGLADLVLLAYREK